MTIDIHLAYILGYPAPLTWLSARSPCPYVVLDVLVTGVCGGGRVPAVAASKRAVSDRVLSRKLLMNISACWSTLPSYPSMGFMRTVLHPAMGSTERVADDVAEGHVGGALVVATILVVGDAVAQRGAILDRRYDEEAMMRFAVMMVEDSKREELFLRLDGAILATSQLWVALPNRCNCIFLCCVSLWMGLVRERDL